MNRRFSLALAVSLSLVITLSGCGESKPTSDVISAGQIFDSSVTIATPTGSEDVTASPIPSESPAPEVESTPLVIATPEPVTCTIVAVGDTLASNGTHKSGKYPDGTYNYDHIFANTKADIEAADLAIVNEEVMLGGVDLGLTGYPLFNAAYELGDSIAAAGFDVVLLASNHTIDKGEKGFDNCINFWRNNYPEIGIVGVNQTPEEVENIYVREVNGIKIAILNYTYGLNGLHMPSNREYMVNLLDEEDRVVNDLKKARELADFVIVCPHWGTEYVYKPVAYQTNWAQIMADNGADLILGTHPHVIEPVEWITGKDGHETLCYYSLGNFNSNQNKAPRLVEAMANVTLTKDETGVYISEYGVTPLVCHQNWDLAGLTTYRLDEYTEALSTQNAIRNNDSTWSLQFAKDLCKQVFGDLYTIGSKKVSPQYSNDYGVEIRGSAPSGNAR